MHKRFAQLVSFSFLMSLIILPSACVVVSGRGHGVHRAEPRGRAVGHKKHKKHKKAKRGHAYGHDKKGKGDERGRGGR